jgi:hypothetical protein
VPGRLVEAGRQGQAGQGGGGRGLVDRSAWTWRHVELSTKVMGPVVAPSQNNHDVYSYSRMDQAKHCMPWYSTHWSIYLADFAPAD